MTDAGAARVRCALGLAISVRLACEPGTAVADGGFPPGAHADSAVVVEGAVRAHARPVAGADVVVTRADGSGRRVAITAADGTFTVTAPVAPVVRIFVVTGWGMRSAERLVQVESGTRIVFDVADPEEPAVELAIGPPSIETADVVHPLALSEGGRVAGETVIAISRTGDLADAMCAVPGTAPLAAPAIAPVVFGTGPGELPVFFEGFSLADPIDGHAPFELPVAIFGRAQVAGPGAPTLSLSAPFAERAGARLMVGAMGAASARGAGGIARPRGVSGGAAVELGATTVSGDGSARLAVVAAPLVEPWRTDPGAVADPRGARLASLPISAWGSVERAGWVFAGGGIAALGRTKLGRASRLEVAETPSAEDHSTVLVGLHARRQLSPGRNELDIGAGLFRSSRDEDHADGSARTSRGLRGSLGGDLRLAFHGGGAHEMTARLGSDFESVAARGFALTGRSEPAIVHATGHVFRPELVLAERYAPVPSLSFELGARGALAAYTGDVTDSSGLASARDFTPKVFLGPWARVAWNEALSSTTNLGLAFEGGRTETRLPLGAVLGASAAPVGSAVTPYQDHVQAVVSLTHGRANLRLGGAFRRLGAIVEDRFAPATGLPELYGPNDVVGDTATRTYRALFAGVDWTAAAAQVGLSAVVARQSGNHFGFIDESTGALRPAATNAFDGPDVAANRAGPSPYDRRYGLRAYLEGRLGQVAGFEWSGAMRGRLDDGVPRSAVARSATSGEGAVFLIERGSYGRTSPLISFDAGVAARRQVGRTTYFVARLEGFGVAANHPAVARNPRASDALIAPMPGARGSDGLATALPTGRNPDFDHALAYAEPLLVRLTLGLEL